MKNVNQIIAFIIANVIGDGKSATFGSIVAVVEQKMRKTGNPFRGCVIEKVGKYNVTFNANYANAVNNQLKREGEVADFQAQGNWFHKGFDQYNGSIIVKNDGVNKGKFYLSAIVNSYEKFGYLVNGKPASDATTAIIEQFKITSTAPTNQGTEKPIIFRTFMLENVREIKANGLTFTW
jgi:hypothetical protein